MDTALNSKVLDWLLEPDSPGVRYLALRDLGDLPADDPEFLAARRTAHREGPIAQILANMEPAGFWSKAGEGYNPKYFSTVWALINLGQLGARIDEDERIQTACNYAIEHSMTKGAQFTVTGAPSGTIDCLQGNLCWALTEMGIDDLRLDAAFEWMARTVTGEGIAPLEEKTAKLRYYAGKCGPVFACGANGKLPCAWGAVKVMLALGRIPEQKRTTLEKDAIQMGIDFLFSVDPVTAAYPSFPATKPNRSWWKFGFPVFYVTDILQIAEALVQLGYAKDARLAKTLEHIRGCQDVSGKWTLEYDLAGKTLVDYGAMHKPNKWVTLRALRVLKAA